MKENPMSFKKFILTSFILFTCHNALVAMKMEAQSNPKADETKQLEIAEKSFQSKLRLMKDMLAIIKGERQPMTTLAKETARKQLQSIVVNLTKEEKERIGLSDQLMGELRAQNLAAPAPSPVPQQSIPAPSPTMPKKSVPAGNPFMHFSYLSNAPMLTVDFTPEKAFVREFNSIQADYNQGMIPIMAEMIPQLFRRLAHAFLQAPSLPGAFAKLFKIDEARAVALIKEIDQCVDKAQDLEDIIEIAKIQKADVQQALFYIWQTNSLFITDRVTSLMDAASAYAERVMPNEKESSTAMGGNLQKFFQSTLSSYKTILTELGKKCKRKY